MEFSFFKIFNKDSGHSAKSGRSAPVIIICFLISAFLWAIIMLSRNYNAHVRFPLLYENIPSGKLVTNHLPKRIEFFINASGFDLIYYRLKSGDNPISINVNDHLEDRNRITDNVYRVPTRSLLSDFTEQLKRDVNIQSILPDSIEFNFSRILNKKVPLKSNVKINFEKQFNSTGASHLIPDSIVVSGPLSYLDTLHWIETADTTFNNLKGNVNQPVSLKFDNNLNSEVKSVRFVLPVEMFTEGTLQIPLQPIHVLDHQKLKIFPDKVTVNYLVALSNYEKVKEPQFTVTVDASEIGAGSAMLNVQLSKNPEFVKVTAIEPQKVEYIILK